MCRRTKRFANSLRLVKVIFITEIGERLRHIDNGMSLADGPIV
jgi:hypothetical protein